MATAAQSTSPEESIDRLLFEIRSSAESLAISEEQLEAWGAFAGRHAYRRDEWRKVAEEAANARQKISEERSQAWWRSFVRRRLIDEWLDANTQIKSGSEREKLANQICISIRDDQEEELREHLRDVVTV